MLSSGLQVGFEAWVERKHDGRRLKEYAHRRLGRQGHVPVTRCYLESRHGVTFEICVKILNTLPRDQQRFDWSIHCKIDGLDIGAETATWVNRTARFTSMHLRERGQDYEADLVFGPLRTTDDPSKVTLDDEDLEEVGKIVISLERGFTGEEYDVDDQNPLEDVAVGVAHERKKKMGTTIGAGARRPVPRGTTQIAWDSYDEDHYFMQFIFDHRTEFELERDRIIPPRPSRSSSHAGPSRPRRVTVDYDRRQVAGDDSTDEEDDVAGDSDFEGSDPDERSNVNELAEDEEEGDVKPAVAQAEASSRRKRKRPPRTDTEGGSRDVVDLTALDSDDDP